MPLGAPSRRMRSRTRAAAGAVERRQLERLQHHVSGFSSSASA
jgi:hypothetical protein